MEDADDKHRGGESEFPQFGGKVSVEAKLKELLRNLTSVELQLCLEASKDITKLLKSESGPEFLRLYISNSPKCIELSQVWESRKGNFGFSNILNLIAAILSHPYGKLQNNSELDKFARWIVVEKMGDLYRELNSKDGKRQNAVLSLLSAIVRRGSWLAWEVAKDFDFKIPIFGKLAEWKVRKVEGRKKHRSTRKAFVKFAMSFLEVGSARLLRGVLQQKDMYSGVLRGLGNDDDDTVIYVLSTLRDRVLVPDSLVPPGLRSVLFGSVTLEQLVSISGREDGGEAAELAHSVLLMVCTDPSNGLMPDPDRVPSPLRGNPRRLLGVMKKLRATEFEYHKNILLAIVKGKPSLGSAYFDEFPYNTEDPASPNWFATTLLAANVILSVRDGYAFGFVDILKELKGLESPDVENILKCIGPRPFTRLIINKGLLHSDPLVKHGTLRLVLESLRFLDSLIDALNCISSSNNQMMHLRASLKLDIVNEVRILLPDPQVLFSLLSSLNGYYRILESCAKRAADSEIPFEDNMSSRKKLKTEKLEEDTDIIVSGFSSTHGDVDMQGDSEAVLDEDDPVQSKNETHFLKLIRELWSKNLCSFKDLVEDAETHFYTKLLDVLKLYYRTMPNMLEGSFDFFKVLPSNPLALPIILQQSLLSLLIEHIGWSSTSESAFRAQSQLYKNLLPLLNLLIYSSDKSVKDQAYILAKAAILSTGAFDNNPREVCTWFLFIPGYSEGSALAGDVKREMFRKLSSVVLSFLCDAVSTAGNNLFKYMDLLRSYIHKSQGGKAHISSANFSCFSICIMEKCLRLLCAESGSFSLAEKSMISLYVSNTFKYILQTQVDARVLASLIDTLLSERLKVYLNVADDSSGYCEWRPLTKLIQFSWSILENQTCSSSSTIEEVGHHENSYSSILREVRSVCKTESDGRLVEVMIRFSFSMICAKRADLLQNFPVIVSVSKKMLGVPFSLLMSIFFLEPSLLIDVSKTWPEMFFTGLESAISGLQEGRTEEFGDIDSMEFASAALSLFLKEASLCMLFPITLSIYKSDLSTQQGLHNLLLANLSERTPDHIVSSFLYVLFWFNQAHISYRVEPLEELEMLSELCFNIVDRMLRQFLNTKGDASSKCTRSLLPTKCVQELIETIFYHPVVAASLECPLPCNADFTDTFSGDSMDKFLESNKWRVIHKMDLHVINLLRTTFELLYFCDGQTSSFEACHARQVTKAFKNVVQKLFLTFKDRTDKCIESKDLTPLLPAIYAIHTLKRFIFPFELLELVHWMFSRIDLEDNSFQQSLRDSVLRVGLHIAGSVFDSLSACMWQPHSERPLSDLFWGMLEEQFDIVLLEKILLQVYEIATHLHLDVADMCLLKAFKVVKTHKVMQQSNPTLVMAISRFIVNIPVNLLSYCMFQINKRKAELLFLATEMSPLHLSIFGHLLSGMIDKQVHLQTNAIRETSNPSDPELLMLLPTVFLYLDSVLIKAGSQVKYFEKIVSFYWRILLHIFSDWKCYVTRDMFDIESFDNLPLSIEEFMDIFSCNLLSRSVLMVQLCSALTGYLVKFEARMELFDSVCPQKSTCVDFLDFDPSQVGTCSLEQSLNFVNRTVAKINLCRTLLFPEHNKFSSGLKEDKMETCAELHSTLDVSRIRLLKMLVSSWRKIVEKFPMTADNSCQMEVENCSVFRFLEVLILRNIVELSKEMHGCLVKLDSLPFIVKLAKTTFWHRFDDPMTLQKLRDIISSLSEGKFSCVKIIQLMVAHSQFETAICSSNLSTGISQLGLTFTPLPSLMRSFVIPLFNHNSICRKDNLQMSKQHLKQLELIKLLRVLFQVKARQVDIEPAQEIGINLRDLVFLLLSSYNATLCDIDFEIHNLVNEIKSISDSNISIAEWDYLWGNAVVKARKERELVQTVSCNLSDAEVAEDCRKIQFRENLPIDPKMCASTVLYFPYGRPNGPGVVNKVQKDTFDSMHEDCSAEVANRHIYDPIFILRLSFHCLSMGYIEPVEFANLGLLAVSLASISSPDDDTRKLGYGVLEKFKNALEKCQKKKDVMRLQLLLSYLQNCIEEDWQKIPSVTAIFIAEASFVLLDPSHDHYATITKHLMQSPSVNLKSIPLFQNLLWSDSVSFRTERLWILRILYSGLNTDDDVHIYIRNSIFETLLSFYVSPLADNESKELIIQTVKKSAKLSRMARHLIENCGLISWLSSVVTSFCGIKYDHWKGFPFAQFAVVLEVVNEIIFFRHTVEWLQKYALEQLSELSCHLCQILVEGAQMLKEHSTFTKLILQILTLTWKVSQKRKVYQPHFTLSVEGLFHLCEAIDVCCNGCYSPIAKTGLEAILMSTPPVAILQMDCKKVSKFINWAMSIALQSETKGVLQVEKCCFPLNVSSEEETENSLISKLLRWLTASVILGKISYKLSKLDSSHSCDRSKLINLHCLLEWNEESDRENGKEFACQEILAASIFYLQQLLGTSFKLLPSAVSALCLLLLKNPASSGSEVLIGNAAALCSKIRCPAEANSAWRWSFYQPWKDHSSNLTDSEKIEEIHACQMLLLVASKMLARNSLYSKLISLKDVEKLGVFEWERSILNLNHV